jgi:hypothetical protein
VILGVANGFEAPERLGYAASPATLALEGALDGSSLPSPFHDPLLERLWTTRAALESFGNAGEERDPKPEMADERE